MFTCKHNIEGSCKHDSCSQIFGLGCFGASLLGVLLVARVVKRSGKASIVVFLLAMVIGIGGILTAIFGGRDAILARLGPETEGCIEGCLPSTVYAKNGP